MKKLLIVSLFFLVISLLVSSSAFALIVTDSTDVDNFLYEVPLQFATKDLAATLTAEKFPTATGLTPKSNEYTLLRDGKLVGIAVAGDDDCTAGGATFDVTINGAVTGVQAWISPAPAVSALGMPGTTGKRYSYARQHRADPTTEQGFKRSIGSYYHSADFPYGKATPLSAGDRIGVKVTTSSGFAPISSDWVATVYVLE